MPVVLFAAKPGDQKPKRTGWLRVVVFLAVAGLFFAFSKNFMASSTQSTSNSDMLGMSSPQIPLSITTGGVQESGSTTKTASRSTDEIELEPNFATPEERWAKIFIGRWEQKDDDYSILTAKDDGTATIVAKLAGSKAYLLGDTLTLNVEWRIANSELKFKIVGGQPNAAYQVVTQVYGTERVYKIVDFTSESIQLINPKGETSVPWNRLADQSL